jgi:hypothetical protein
VAPLRGFIICRDRVSYASQCAVALAGAGLDVCPVDCGSTWPPAVRWLDDAEAAGRPVLRRGPGGHPRDLWKWEPFRQACGDGPYVVTDADVVPSADCPADWPARLTRVLESSGIPKAGLGLRLDRIPATYQRRDQVLTWEEQFWVRPLGDGTFDAIIDTTLALYRPLAEQPDFTLTAVRTGPPYVADHLAWYEDYDHLTPEQAWYHQYAEPGISYWTLPGHSVWGN